MCRYRRSHKFNVKVADVVIDVVEEVMVDVVLVIVVVAMSVGGAKKLRTIYVGAAINGVLHLERYHQGRLANVRGCDRR
jgi:hypothetical protein